MGPGEEQHCASCGELNPARAKFCLECGSPFELVDRLPQAEGTAGERRIVSVLFADLSGFTAYSEDSDVEDVRAIAQETANQLGDIVVRYGGTIDKIIGDCVMAVWGAPAAHEDDPERAVRAALDMQECVAANRERFAGLALSVGIQTGEAIWAPLGADGLYTVLGDSVNTAARLQGAAAKGEVLIGRPTYSEVADVIECEPIEPIKAKNKAEPVPAWRAVAVKGERRAHKPVMATLVGRDAELNRLREVWENATSEKRSYGVTVIGSPGVGKSRLVDTFTDDAASSALVLRGRCLPYGEGITYWPVAEIIRQAAQIRHDDDRDTVSNKLGAFLESLGSDDLDELRTMAVAVANLVGAPTTPRGTYTAIDISRGELHWGLRRIIELRAGIDPTVLVFEDLHWAEPTLLELIDFTFETPMDVPLLGICTGRPELRESGAALLTRRPNRRVIDLELLDDEAARGMVRQLMGQDDLPDGTVRELLTAAGGNPLFLEEIVQMWREQPDGAAADQLRVPSGLQALIDSRLDRLPADERRLVTHASVIGNVFWTGTIAYLEGDSDIDSVLDSLEGRDLIRALPSSSLDGQQEYTFKHGLIRDAAYARLTKAERAELHQRCGTWVTQLPGGEDEFAEIIAYHLEQACRIASDLSLAHSVAPMLPAARALIRAGDKAEAREGMREAERFLARAVDLLGDDYPETALESSLRRARMLAGLGEYEEAVDAMRRVADAAASFDRTDLRCRALISLAEVRAPMGAGAEAQSYLEEAEPLVRELADPSLRIRATWTKAMIVYITDGATAAALEALQSAVALAEEVDEAEFALTARMHLGALYFNKGDLPLAEVHFERCLELAGQQGSLRAQAWVSACLGLIRFHRGPRPEAEELLVNAADWMERTNDRYMQAQTLTWRAYVGLSRKDVDLALSDLRKAEGIVREIGGQLAVRVGRYLAEAFAWQGRAHEAREIVELARAHAEAEDQESQALLLIAEAFGAHAAGDQSEARRRFTQALPILDKRDALVDLGEARLSFAQLLEAMGEATAAGDQLERAREVFEKVGALETLQQVEENLARLRDIEIGSGPGRSSLEDAPPRSV